MHRDNNSSNPDCPRISAVPANNEPERMSQELQQERSKENGAVSSPSIFWNYKLPLGKLELLRSDGSDTEQAPCLDRAQICPKPGDPPAGPRPPCLVPVVPPLGSTFSCRDLLNTTEESQLALGHGEPPGSPTAVEYFKWCLSHSRGGNGELISWVGIRSEAGRSSPSLQPRLRCLVPAQPCCKGLSIGRQEVLVAEAKVLISLRLCRKEPRLLVHPREDAKAWLNSSSPLCPLSSPVATPEAGVIKGRGTDAPPRDSDSNKSWTSCWGSRPQRVRAQSVLKVGHQEQAGLPQCLNPTSPGLQPLRGGVGSGLPPGEGHRQEGAGSSALPPVPGKGKSLDSDHTAWSSSSSPGTEAAASQTAAGAAAAAPCLDQCIY
ncbi:uncharacterized protein PRD47_008650 [Ara ararauna]